MLLDMFLLIYLMFFIIGIVMAILYGSVGVGLLMMSLLSLIASGQPQLFGSLSLMLKVVSVLTFLLAALSLYRAYIKARWDEYHKRMGEYHTGIQIGPVSPPVEPVSPPVDYLLFLANKVLNCLRR